MGTRRVIDSIEPSPSVSVYSVASCSSIFPFRLRHCYATHAHRSGAAARDLQEVLGHRHLETTMRYLTADAGRVRSPLEVLG